MKDNRVTMRKISHWKKKLKERYLYYTALIAIKDYDMGNNLVEYICPEIGVARRDVNAAIRMLKKLDPDNCPDELK